VQEFPITLAVVLALLSVALAPLCEPQPNHIQDENALPGTTAWQLDGPISDDASGQIQGYASLTSVDQGDTIDLHITVSPPQDYWIEIYRMGWYDGDGRRLMKKVGPLKGTKQDECRTFERPNSSVSCAWDVGHSRSGSSVCQAARLHPWSEGCRPGDSVGRVLG
jgi:hypothetical protein